MSAWHERAVAGVRSVPLVLVQTTGWGIGDGVGARHAVPSGPLGHGDASSSGATGDGRHGMCDQV